MSREYLSFAKINMFLEVEGKRSDGYHNIISIFARISLADKIFIQKRSDKDVKIGIRSNIGPINIPTEENLVFKAIKTFQENFGIHEGFNIEIEKNIPIGSGLGGGSSNCATTLLAMCDMYGIEYSSVYSIGAMLGSDVSFFMKNTSFALVKGRGEIVEEIKPKCRLPYSIIVFPGISISTKLVYSSMNYNYTPKNHLCYELIKHFQKNDKVDFSKYIFNRLEEPAFKIEKRLINVKEEILNTGLITLMSGSGSSFFGLSYDKKSTESAFNKLKQKYSFVFKIKFV